MNLDADELDMIRIAMAELKQQMTKDGKKVGLTVVPTPLCDSIILKVNAALIEEQKDIDFEKRRNAINQN